MTDAECSLAIGDRGCYIPRMTLPVALPNLSAVAEDYDVLLCDVWGVIHNGRESWPAACEALTRFNEKGGHVVLISNSPRPSSDVISQLDGLNVPRSSWKRFVTSGDATRAELAKRAPGPAMAIGPDRDATTYEGTGLTLVDSPTDAAFVSVTGLVDDATETPEDYRDLLTAAADKGLDLICANPDRVVQKGDSLIYCAGALADLYEELGGTVIMAGKPFAPIYDLALIEAESLIGGPVNRSRVLCIGDGVITDVLGAENQKLDCLFIAQGIHGDKAKNPDGALDSERAGNLLKAENTSARYAALDLAW